ncbi:hypothetical protein IAD21_04515 [Abditibacteriota bacterium]|nr:hypothetical protein IAD21_04515 [Abditibacteriota bacterium]
MKGDNGVVILSLRRISPSTTNKVALCASVLDKNPTEIISKTTPPKVPPQDLPRAKK